ncbi:hypothetical protein NXF25_006696 [Crotalus adamanteus]|uniref:Ig-like domain-containing protein n=1 Tax=Crotalus adamanteus TaxID=8729 RepID=A0AAW1C2C7_CROAD
MEVIWWETVGLKLLAVYAGLCHAIIVTQKERFKIIPEGIQTNITCNYDDSSYIILFWYRQDSNAGEKQFQLIGYSIAESDTRREILTYEITRRAVTHSSLIIPPEEAAKPAVYFCAVSEAQ